jgi:molybdopterin/thiamine biosynthesis adenylyltransferase
MNLNKSKEFFDPVMLKQPIHLIGCGSVGSSLAELLARQGCTDIHLWDFDIVEPHNIVNQMYLHTQVNMEKTSALWNLLYAINPDLNERVTLHKGWEPGKKLSGYVFLCVDSIETRKAIVEDNLYNKSILAMFDFRMTLLEGQLYAVNWADVQKKQDFLNTMNFTHEEAVEATPVTACGFELSVAPTIRTATAVGMANFMNFVNTGSIQSVILVNPFRPGVVAL